MMRDYARKREKKDNLGHLISLWIRSELRSHMEIRNCNRMNKSLKLLAKMEMHWHWAM